MKTDDGFISTPYMTQEELDTKFDDEGKWVADDLGPDTNISQSVSGGGSISIGIASVWVVVEVKK